MSTMSPFAVVSIHNRFVYGAYASIAERLMYGLTEEEDLRLNIIVNGDKGRKEIADLEASAKKASRSLKELSDRNADGRRPATGGSATSGGRSPELGVCP